MSQIGSSAEPETRYLESDGKAYPNNPNLPVLIYRGIFRSDQGSIADRFEASFYRNSWIGCWRWSVYDFHHYHSNAHEALGVSQGEARLQLGGPHGETIDVSARTLIVLPAGTGHKKLQSSADFLVVGAYPIGQGLYDTNRGGSMDFDEALSNIASKSLPETDPVYGPEGPLIRIWGNGQ